MIWNKNLHWLVYAIFIFSCARVTSPTGGAKDTIPPVLVESSPSHQEVKFRRKSLELLFSELVVVNNPKEQMIITPSLGKNFKAEARKNKVLVTFENDFQDSTTYTFNFRDAVQDITEKNPARNLILAISTGSYIDSLTVEGTVFSMKDQLPLKDVTVAIQTYSDTFNMMKHPATYFTKTDAKGKYKLDNLKPGIYKLYAMGDQNKNLIADTKNESYGFKRDSIFLDQDIEKVKLNMVKLDTRPLKLTSARPYNTYFNIRASKNLKDYKIIPLDTSVLYSSYGSDKSNIQIYNTLDDKDSLQIQLSLLDSIYNKFDTTLYIKFSNQDATPEKFDFEVKETKLLANRGIYSFELKFTKPVKEVNFDSVYFQIDSLNILRFAPENLNYQENDNTITIEKRFDPALFKKEEPNTNNPAGKENTPKEKPKPKKGNTVKNKLIIGKGAFLSIEKDSSKAIITNMIPLKTEDLGVIYAEVKEEKTKIIIQLLNRVKAIKGSAIHQTKATFEDLQPDEYQLRIILDRNKNGVWDPGNYLKNEEPEEIYYWTDENGNREIKLKANFEFGPLLITY